MRIGIILTGDYGWAGGVYYSLNVIKLLQEISLSKNLKIVVIANAATPPELIKELTRENSEISFLDKKPFFYKLYHKIKNDRFVADINALRLDVLYPLMYYDHSHSKLSCKVYYWMYDFQHKFLPELFSKEEIIKRDLNFEGIAKSAKNVIFSSYDSLDHFDKFYPGSKARKHVYNFVSLIDGHSDLPETKYTVPDNYFIVCNQFWPHKNHKVVLKALRRLLDEKKQAYVIFTGKYNDERNKSYVKELNSFIAEQHLEKNVTFTGFISRQEQVKLMQNAKAIIQPSFFEGWSTVVEDAKALNKFLIVSDIKVNREQIGKNVLFFNPEDDEQLAGQLSKLNEEKIVLSAVDYHENIKTSQNVLIKLFEI